MWRCQPVVMPMVMSLIWVLACPSTETSGSKVSIKRDRISITFKSVCGCKLQEDGFSEKAISGLLV